LAKWAQRSFCSYAEATRAAKIKISRRQKLTGLIIRLVEEERRLAMPRQSESYKEYLFERLKSPEEAAGYLNAALEEGDMVLLLMALRDVAEARGIARVAAEANLNRENVYRMLSEEGNPRLSSLCALLRALGIELQVKSSEKVKTVAATAAATVTPILAGSMDKLEEVQPSLKGEENKGREYASDFNPNFEPLAA
jgi:probable addiction module antidote protein